MVTGDVVATSELSNCRNLLNEMLDAEKEREYKCLDHILKDLNSRMSSESEKLKVDPEDCLSDALAYYKNPDFDPRLKLQIKYSKQPAVDTGGVLRQFYSDCAVQLTEGVDGPALFEGADHRKLPGFNAGVVMSGIVKYVGKMFAHSICQVGLGFDCLAPAAYYYICTGDSTVANKYAVIDDVTNPLVRSYLEKVKFVKF